MKLQYNKFFQPKHRSQYFNALDIIETQIEDLKFLVELNFRAYGINGVVRCKKFLQVFEALQIFK